MPRANSHCQRRIDTPRGGPSSTETGSLDNPLRCRYRRRMIGWLTTLVFVVLCLPLTASAAVPATGATGEAAPTVAVLYFNYEGGDEELKALSKGLASMLITDMSANGGFQVVERERLQELIGELKLSQSDLVDPDKALKIGKLVGAQRMVFGRYFE